jgi:hypothetical protein
MLCFPAFFILKAPYDQQELPVQEKCCCSGVFGSVADPGSSAFFLTPGSGILIKGTEEQATGQAGIRPANSGHVGATSSVFPD